MFRVLVVAALLAVATAGGCDNDCSGHGTCLQNGVCACYDNWGMGMGLDSGDCSERICPFEFAWVDTPDKLGNHHKYAECSNRGICDRDSGECECFPGYEGKGCARTSCPNDCSGHGRCKYIEDLPFQVTPQQFDVRSFFPQKAHTFGDAYKNWDSQKTRGCQCDPEWGDVDCSKRMCQHGNDIMDQRDNLGVAQKHHVQHIQFVADHNAPAYYTANSGDASLADLDQSEHISTNSGRDILFGKTFALTFTSKLNETFTTIPIKWPARDDHNVMHAFFLQVEHALEGLPNGVIDNVKVMGEFRVASYEDVTDTDAAGNPLEGNIIPWYDGEKSNTLHDASGIIVGDGGLDGGEMDPDALYLNVTFLGKNVQGPQNLIQVKHIACADGCTPKLSGLDLRYNSMNVTELIQADYNSYECGRRGKCDYDSGICECFSGYSGLSCGTITSLV